jgi:phenylacetate-CoA ligase
MLIIRGVNVFPSQIEEQLLSIEGLSPHYLVEVAKMGHMDYLTVKVERSMNQQSNKDQAKLLESKIKSVIGISSKVVILEPQTIARSEGKASRVTDLR